MNNPAPIVLFVYNRPWHTRQTIESLQANDNASKSELFIYADAAKNEQDQPKVNEVRNYIKTIDGFKKIEVIERKSNFGLANNIIDGTTHIIHKYGKIIVMEDDLVSNPDYLNFMNQSLEIYKNIPNVWHISGWNYPISPDGLEDIFFWRAMNCWGWATWVDRWSSYDKDPTRLIHCWSNRQKRNFDLDGLGGFWEQVEANAEGKIDTWAIFWYATIFENNGLCLNPVISYINNIGHDGSGENCGTVDFFSTYQRINKSRIYFTDKIIESEIAVNKIKNIYKKNKIYYPKKFIAKIAKILRGIVQ